MYRHVVIPSSLLSSDLSLNNAVIASSFSRENKEIKSIDLICMKYRKKKILPFQSVRCLKEVAIDCQLFKKEMKKIPRLITNESVNMKNVYYVL